VSEEAAFPPVSVSAKTRQFTGSSACTDDDGRLIGQFPHQDGMTADFYPFDMAYIGHVATRHQRGEGR
jgi:hypothetical protein